MPQYIIKLNTYDPAIMEAFERLRKSRKLASFTHEALKYFIASEKGEQVITLMGGLQEQLLSSSDKGKIHFQNPSPSTTPPFPSTFNSLQDNSAMVLEKILK